MKVWILQTGEPLHIDKNNPRPMRGMNMADALTERGHEVVFWSSAFYHQQKYHRSTSYESITVSDLLEIRLISSPGYEKNISLSRLWDHYILARNLSKQLSLSTDLPDVAFIGYPPIEITFVMAKFLKNHKIPYFLDVKDQWPSFMVSALPTLARPIGRIAFDPYFRMAAKTLQGALGITAMADGFLDWALRFSARERNEHDTVLPLTTKFSKISDQSRNVAMQWWQSKGVDTNNALPRIMFVGSHYPSLDFYTVLDAAKLMYSIGSNCQFVICGHGQLTEDLIQYANDTPNVIFPGWVDTAQIYTLASLSIATLSPFKDVDNYTVNMPNKIIDSLALGLPILSPLSGEVKKIITNNNVGLFYEQKRPERLTTVIQALIDDVDLQKQMSTNAMNLYSAEFSFEKVYGGFIDKMTSSL